MAGSDPDEPGANAAGVDRPEALAGFSPATRAWFTGTFGRPTPVQAATWHAIAGGENALVVAPTGSGKTLAAFLHAIDRLTREKAERARGTRVLYISPVKALAADIRKNLDLPLQGIDAHREARGESASGITVGMRTGDTPASERARLLRRPPDILVTTPESLFLMLTSKARETLSQVGTVIVDEVHSVAGTKRGSHLALSLERLDELLEQPARRIGLSATVSPLDTVAAFLGGAAPVTVVQPPAERVPDMRIVVPVEDLGDIAGSATGPTESSLGNDERIGSIWPHIEVGVLDQVMAHRSTIVFVNSRGLAEKLTAKLNELHAQRTGGTHPEVLHSAAGPTTGRKDHAQRGAASEAPEPPETIARSHHGSVSKEQRLLVENELKSGELRCVVATSSLELGIDMGEVDLVIQIAAPPDVASGLQRVGRANHQVGARATGLIYPRTRRDLLESAVIVERMERGQLEPLAPPRNPLDVLAQHTVSLVAMDDATADAWFATVRRAHPFRELTRASFESVLGMLAGRWSTEEFAGLRPQLVWDRTSGALTARPGAQRLATTNAGTIPDRGTYSVLLPEGEESTGARRVGELDEEMVHESRVGDIITLGAGSWRIQEISTDRVTVVPAPGRSARLPFWRGEGPGRHAELGAAMGAFARRFDLEKPDADRVTANLRSFLTEQRKATGVVPSDTDLVLETCPDEAGDLRLILHSPYGKRVHAPWALAIGERLREIYGGDASVVAADNGIVARIPAQETAHISGVAHISAGPRISGTAHIPRVAAGGFRGPTPGAELLDFDPEHLVQRVEHLVGGSALFAARFRECAARALLMPRRDPGRRTPLWQQRLRAGQLLEEVARFPDFPILVETARECLQDVYDLPELQRLTARIRGGEVRVSTVETQVPSPFASDLLFGYVGEFLYEGDRPLAERRASALTLDPIVLADLVGRGEASELLDPAIVEQVETELQRTAPGRQTRGTEGVADLLRDLGPLTPAEVAQRLEPPEATGPAEAESALAELANAARAIPVSMGELRAWAAAEDAGRLRAVLGFDAVPAVSEAAVPGIPDEFLNPGSDPLGDLVLRFARTHGTFTTDALAARFGLGTALVQPVLDRLRAAGTLLSLGETWIHEDVFARVRRRALHAAREATRPVPARAYVRLLTERQFVTRRLHGTGGLVRVVEQLAGLALPASLWESQILPARVDDYSPRLLDELIAGGEVFWAPASGERGRGTRGGGTGAPGGEETDPHISLHLTELAAETLPEEEDVPFSALQEAVLEVLGAGGAWSAAEIATRISTSANAPDPGESVDESALRQAIWGLAGRGLVVSDSFAPVRGAAEQPRAGGRGRSSRGTNAARSGHRRSRRGRGGLSGRSAGRPASYGSAYRSLPPAHSASSSSAASAGAGPSFLGTDSRLRGRWSLADGETLSLLESTSPTERVLGVAETLLDRYGVVTRSTAVAEKVPGGFPVLQRVFSSLEDAGEVVRGRFVTGFGGAQFAEHATVDRLRDLASTELDSAEALGAAQDGTGFLVLSAADPANPFGRSLPWPAATAGRGTPTRAPGSLVVLSDGVAIAWLARGGKSLLTFPPDEAVEGGQGDEANAEEYSALGSALARAVVDALGRFGMGSFTLETIDGRSALSHPWSDAFQQAGLSISPRGLRFYG